VSDGRALARAYLEQQRLLGTDAVMVPAPDQERVPTTFTPGLRPGLFEPTRTGTDVGNCRSGVYPQ